MKSCYDKRAKAAHRALSWETNRQLNDWFREYTYDINCRISEACDPLEIKELNRELETVFEMYVHYREDLGCVFPETNDEFQHWCFNKLVGIGG